MQRAVIDGLGWPNTKVWHPCEGCSRVSEACKFCYAARYFKDNGLPFKFRTCPDKLDEPIHWISEQIIFVASRSDLFHKDMPPYFLDKILKVMAKASQHIYLVLTKRPENILSKLYSGRNRFLSPGEYLPNLYLGVSAENQAMCDLRIPQLLKIPAKYRFVSVCPIMGPVDISRWVNRLTFVMSGPKMGIRGQRDTLELFRERKWLKALAKQCPVFWDTRRSLDARKDDFY